MGHTVQIHAPRYMWRSPRAFCDIDSLVPIHSIGGSILLCPAAYPGIHRGGGANPKEGGAKLLFGDISLKTAWKQECIPVGYVPFAAVAVCWGRGGVVCPGRECLPARGVFACQGGDVCLPEGCLPRGCLPPGGCLPARVGVHLLLLTDRHPWKHNLSATTVADGTGRERLIRTQLIRSST